MLSHHLSRTARPTRLLFGTLLGLMTLGVSAQQASANPLQVIPIVSDLLGATNRPAPLPDQLDVFNDNVQGNNVSICVLTCTPGGIPGLPAGARPPVPGQRPASRPTQPPVGARPPVPGQLPPGVRPPSPVQQRPTSARPPAPRSNRPSVNLDLSPINIPL